MEWKGSAEDDPNGAVEDDLSECCALGLGPNVSDVGDGVESDHRGDKQVDDEDDLDQNPRGAQRSQRRDSKGVRRILNRNCDFLYREKWL